MSEIVFTPDEETRYGLMCEIRPSTTREEFRAWLDREPPAVGSWLEENSDICYRATIWGDEFVVVKRRNYHRIEALYIYRNRILTQPDCTPANVHQYFTYAYTNHPMNPEVQAMMAEFRATKKEAKA